jgi:FtsP/CotA-like multicopper oxidase with cupredoxin domain
VLGPGDRAELEWRVGQGFSLQSAPFAVAGGPALGDPVPLLEVRADPEAAPPAGLPWPFSSEAPSPDPGETAVRFLLSGSPEGGWEMNGETFPDVTVPELLLGSEVVLEVRNVSPAHHPFHVHGHHFELLSLDGVAPEHRLLEDTLDIPIFSVARLLLVADNPGLWMTHCHVLPHAEGGMMTLMSVHY